MTNLYTVTFLCETTGMIKPQFVVGCRYRKFMYGGNEGLVQFQTSIFFL